MTNDHYVIEKIMKTNNIKLGQLRVWNDVVAVPVRARGKTFIVINLHNHAVKYGLNVDAFTSVRVTVLEEGGKIVDGSVFADGWSVGLIVYYSRALT